MNLIKKNQKCNKQKSLQNKRFAYGTKKDWMLFTFQCI